MNVSRVIEEINRVHSIHAKLLAQAMKQSAKYLLFYYSFISIHLNRCSISIEEMYVKIK